MKNGNRKLALFICAVLSMSLLGGCSDKAAETIVEDVAIVEAGNPTVGDLKLSGDFIATLNPDESVYVIPLATAEVLEVMVEAGDAVEAGDVLAVLDDTMAQYTMRSAQLGLNTAQTNYDLNFGEGATLLNDMSSENDLSTVEDNVINYQEQYYNATKSLEQAKKDLADKEKEWADLKAEYGYSDIDDMGDYVSELSNRAQEKSNEATKKQLELDPEYKEIQKEALDLADEARRAGERYQEAATKDATIQAEIRGYKQMISGYETSIETYQTYVDSYYEGYSQTIVAQEIQNGEMRDNSKQLSQNNITNAQLQVEQAQENLDNYTITATISGIVETVNINVHDFASSSSPAFVISNKDTMVATYYVSEDVRNTFSIGQQVSIDKDGHTYTGEVIEIGGAVDANTGLFRIKASVKGDTSRLLTGTRATVTTDTYHENNALIIPYDSVYYDGTQAYVYTVVDGKAQRTNITTGLYDIENIVVTSGLTKDDVVINTWSAQLREGVAVSISESE